MKIRLREVPLAVCIFLFFNIPLFLALLPWPYQSLRSFRACPSYPPRLLVLKLTFLTLVLAGSTDILVSVLSLFGYFSFGWAIWSSYLLGLFIYAHEQNVLSSATQKIPANLS